MILFRFLYLPEITTLICQAMKTSRLVSKKIENSTALVKSRDIMSIWAGFSLGLKEEQGQQVELSKFLACTG